MGNHFAAIPSAQHILDYLASRGTDEACMQIRGVNVGQVIQVKPSLSQVDVLVDIKDANTVIPRNSIIEANQSGLIATPLIDITPQLPVPNYQVGFFYEFACSREAALHCW